MDDQLYVFATTTVMLLYFLVHVARRISWAKFAGKTLPQPSFRE